MNQVELYDDQLDFEENKARGPFGGYANPQPAKNPPQATFDFFGKPVFSPFGIAAGPLPNARFIDAALKLGFDIVTLKSVRTSTFPLNPYPQVRPVDVPGDLQLGQSVIAGELYNENHLAVANSFGIPSVEPTEWQAFMRESLALPKKGQTVLAAFQGTAHGTGRADFVQDHVDGVGLIKATGAQIVEINLSCPNEGEAVLACHDTDITEQIVKAVRGAHPNIRFLIKLAYFEDKVQLNDLVQRTAEYVDGYSAINTMSAPVVDTQGNAVFPGRPTAGVSGAPIKWAGLEMTTALAAARQKHDLDYKIIGVGGVQSAQDFHQYLAAGADYVMSVAGAMWNPKLGQEIRASLS